MASSNQNELRRNARFRFYEFIPGTLTWITIILAIFLSFVRPLWVIYFVIVFDLYWLFRVCYFIFYISLSWKNYRRDIRIDWQKKLEAEISDWRKIYHVIFLPTYNESIEVLRNTFSSLVQTKFPLDRFIVVLAGEERVGREAFTQKAEMIKKEFGDNFFRFIYTIHPVDLLDEVPGKGSNINYAGHEIKKIIDQELHIDYQDIIVSSFDIDTCAHTQYFSCLTYKYLTHPDRLKTSYQPIALYNNNIWQSDSITRISSFGTTFWLMTELMRPERLFTFSSHSMSWQMLVDVDFWEKDIVTEDSRIYLQGFLRYNGNYSVTPIFVPVSMTTVSCDSWWQSLKSLYKQQRRWAWGAEHIPYMLWHFKEKKKKNLIPFGARFRLIWNQIEGMYSWATVPILITILGRLPLYLTKGQEKATVLAQNAPFVMEKLMGLAMIGMFISIISNLLMLPPRPDQTPRHKYLIMVLQWVLLPITLILFGSIPAIDAQTRLMLGGKYRLGFWVSPKKHNL
ncbi:MAG: glycosyltransferase family 2 protein [Patescibacteria group bacterium]|jgi:cellulose synthase/poly-beta-1,6-N-acetylglucosamine synthase-like glycosyltransferase